MFLKNVAYINVTDIITYDPISSSWILAELLRPADQPKSTYCSLEHGKEDERNQV